MIRKPHFFGEMLSTNMTDLEFRVWLFLTQCVNMDYTEETNDEITPVTASLIADCMDKSYDIVLEALVNLKNKGYVVRFAQLDSDERIWAPIFN